MQLKTATISKDLKHRYRLGRIIDEVAEGEGTPTACKVLFIMCNPSTADADDNDPTVTRCIGFAKAWGFTSLEVVNLFSYRETDIKEVQKAKKAGTNLLGPQHWKNFDKAVECADMIVAAWGAKVWAKSQIDETLDRLLKAGRDVHAIRLTQKLAPEHPLYLPAGLEPVPFQMVPEQDPNIEDAEFTETPNAPAVIPDASAGSVPMLAEYNPFIKQLKKLTAESKGLVFDITEAKGLKEAKAHIYQFRQAKARLSEARKEAKRVAMEYAKQVDAQAKEIEAQFDALMTVHQKPIDDMNAVEKARIQTHKDHIALITEYEEAVKSTTLTSEGFQGLLDTLIDLNPASDDVSLEELTDEGIAEFNRIWTIVSVNLRGAELTEENERLATEAREAEIKRQTTEEVTATLTAEITQTAMSIPRSDPPIPSPEVSGTTAPVSRHGADYIAPPPADTSTTLSATKEQKAEINRRLVQEFALLSGSLDTEAAKKLVIAIAKGQIKNVAITYG